MKNRRILLAGASSDNLNTNSLLRKHVEEGFASARGAPQIKNVAFECTAEAIQSFEPNVMLFFGSCMPDSSEYDSIAHLCRKKGVLLAFWLHDDPYEIDCSNKIISIADVIFSNDKWSTRFYEHEHVFHLPLAASPNFHFREIRESRNLDFFFCGVAFSNRIAFFRDVEHIINKYKCSILGDGWPKDIPLAENRRLSSEEQVSHYAQSRLTFNLGRSHNLANNKYMLTPSTPGPRTFEAAMAGAVQLFFVESLEICDYYVPDKEILLIDSPSDVQEITERMLDDDESIRRIGTQAQKKTLEKHLYQHRAEQLLDILGNVPSVVKI